MTALAQALVQLGQFSQRLSRVSARTYQNPYTALDWPDSLNPEADWFTSEELLSLHGTEYWDALAEPERRRLSLLEAANFYSLNIHGEKSLMSGLAARLYRPDLLDLAGYLHHFLDEENKHSVYFGGFCTRYAKVYRSRQVPVAADGDRPRDVEDFLFFAKTMVFEEIVDYRNQLQARDARLHQAGLGGQLTDFLLASWREYYNPDVYADLGLADPWGAAEAAWVSQAQRRHRRLASARCLGFLISLGVLPKEVTDAV